MNARLIVTADARQVVTATQQAGTSMQQLVNRTTQVDRVSRSAAESARVFGGGLETAGDQVQRLRQQIDPLYAAQLRLQSGTELVTLAFRRGEVSLEVHDQMLERLQAEYSRTASAQAMLTTQTRGFFAATRGGAGGLQNFSYQLQDIFVQVGSGIPLIRSLGQQAPQLLSGFGAAGAIMGVVAAIGFPLAASLLGVGRSTVQAGNEASEFDTIMGTLGETMDGLDRTSGILAMSVIELYREYGNAAVRVRAFAAAQADLRVGEVRDMLRDQVGVLSEVSREYRQVESSAFRSGTTQAQAISNIARDFEITRTQARELAGEFRALETAGSFDDQQAVLRRIVDLMADYGVQSENIPPAIRTALIQMIELSNENDAAAEAARQLAEAAGLTDYTSSAEGAGELRNELEGAVVVAGRLVTALGTAAAADLTGLNAQVSFLMQRLGLAADEAIRLNNALPGSGGMVQQSPGLSFGMGGVDTQAYGDFGSVSLGYGNLPNNRRNVPGLPEPEDTPGRGGGGQSDHERTVADIERRIRRLSLSYEADTEAANRWREEALANLDATATGYEEFAAQVETIYGEMLAEAYEADLERRDDWRAGIQRGLNQLLEDQMTWADAWENIVTGTIERGEDAWVDWVTTGRLSLEELVNFAIEQFARLAYQQAIQPALQGLFGSLGGIFGGGAGAAGMPMIKSHSGSLAGVNSARATFAGRLGATEELAVVERGQGIFTPRQMENADALLRALASQRSSGGVIVEAPKVEINNYSSARVESQERADGTTEINIMDQVEREMAGRMQTPGAPLNRALRAQGVKPVYGNGRA